MKAVIGTYWFAMLAILGVMAATNSGCAGVRFSPDCAISTASDCINCAAGIASCFRKDIDGGVEGSQE